MVYAQYIANKLDTYQGQTRALVEHAIHNVFFEADVGKFIQSSSTQNVPPDTSYYAYQSHVPHVLQTTPASPASTYINVTSPASVLSDRSVSDSSTVPETRYSNLQELFIEFSNN